MRARLIAVLAVVCLVALACSNSDDTTADSTSTSSGTSDTSGGPVDQPGVTNDTIRVGGVVSKTNALNGPYASAFDGVKAYFDMVNSEGGIHGRDLELVAERDDLMAQNQQEVEALLAQDNVFAVAPVATIFLFSGAEMLAEQKVPTFGLNINTEWTGNPTFFGSNYGALCLGCVGSVQPFVARELGKKKIGVLAYNQATSAQCADGMEKSFAKYPTAEIVFITKSIGFGDTDFSVEVGQMKDEGVDFVLTCMDNTASLNLGKEMRKQDLDATQYLPQGYDVKLAAANAEFFQDDIVGVPFVPFQFRPKPPGMVEFDKWMDKNNYEKNEISINAWISAAMLHEGLELAGPDFTRQKVVDELNKLTDQTVGGLIPARNWTKEHEITHDLACTAFVKIDDGKLVPTFTQPGKPFMCLPDQPAKLPAEATFQ